jgi:hypothetical protein
MGFLDFETFCLQVALPLCPLVGQKVEPLCYARNISPFDVIFFQPATIFIQVIALIMSIIMLVNIKSKYTAVGRKEIVIFFYLYIVYTILEMVLFAGATMGTSTYPWLVAAQLAVLSALFWCLLLNGFVGFQWAEDGTPASLWTIRISSLLIAGAVYFLSIATFQGWIGLDPTNPIALFVILYIFNGLMLFIYVVMQIILVINTLDDRWPLGDILFGLSFFILGQIFEMFLSRLICEAASHYVDGLFFGTTCSLLGVMMVYKYWDSITKEDLEFSVGGKATVWEIRDESEKN